MPKSQAEWLRISEEYEKRWNFPHCIGALDGKHIHIECPAGSGSEYFNYKGTFSIVLMALVDARYCFTFIDVGCQGRISDGGVFRNTVLYKRMHNNELHLPIATPLSSSRSLAVPYVIVADDAFPLTPNIMKPYSGIQEKGSTSRIFNCRCSRARRVVENVFGIMASVFRILRKPIQLEPEKVQVITMTCALLHNFLRNSKSSSSTYTPPGSFDCEKDGQLIAGRADRNFASFTPLQNIPRRPGVEAKEMRNEFADFFVKEGKVRWQDDY